MTTEYHADREAERDLMQAITNTRTEPLICDRCGWTACAAGETYPCGLDGAASGEGGVCHWCCGGKYGSEEGRFRRPVTEITTPFVRSKDSGVWRHGKEPGKFEDITGGTEDEMLAALGFPGGPKASEPLYPLVSGPGSFRLEVGWSIDGSPVGGAHVQASAEVINRLCAKLTEAVRSQPAPQPDDPLALVGEIAESAGRGMAQFVHSWTPEAFLCLMANMGHRAAAAITRERELMEAERTGARAGAVDYRAFAQQVLDADEEARGPREMSEHPGTLLGYLADQARDLLASEEDDAGIDLARKTWDTFVAYLALAADYGLLECDLEDPQGLAGLSGTQFLGKYGDVPRERVVLALAAAVAYARAATVPDTNWKEILG